MTCTQVFGDMSLNSNSGRKATFARVQGCLLEQRASDPFGGSFDDGAADTHG
jgi:hypothetical protein